MKIRASGESGEAIGAQRVVAMNQKTGTPGRRLWIYAVLPALVLNIGAILLYGTYYALQAARSSSVAGITAEQIQFLLYAFVFVVEWAFALLLIREKASLGVDLRSLIASGGKMGVFRIVPATGIFLFFNVALAAYVWLTTILYGAWPNLSNLLTWQRAFLLLAVPISAAFCEELIWRGHLVSALEDAGRTRRSAIALSAVSFACIHGVFFLDKLALTFVIGIVAALYVVKERNLLPLMLAHFVADLWTFGLSVL
jgi:membrane protease YdiL (CAAX protease family)